VTVQAPPQQAISFKGRSLLAFVLTPRMPLERWLADLDAWLDRSPGFFHEKPVMLEISGLSLSGEAYRDFIQDLALRRLRVMAVEGAAPELRGDDLPPQVCGGRPASAASLMDLPGKAEPKPASLVIEGHVRSGQSIFHPEGDVTIIGAVASGAEVIAGGSIHVYGALRGRAMAGVSGEPGARIFCRKLHAEFLSISGAYKAAEEMGALEGRSIHARLDGADMTIVVLD
jgi:septum site-determining protein MinC